MHQLGRHCVNSDCCQASFSLRRDVFPSRFSVEHFASIQGPQEELHDDDVDAAPARGESIIERMRRLWQQLPAWAS